MRHAPDLDTLSIVQPGDIHETVLYKSVDKSLETVMCGP